MSRHNIFYFAKEGAVNMFSHGFMSFATVGITVACLIIMGTFTLVAVNANAMLADLESESQILAFVDLGASEEEARAMEKEILAVDNVAGATFISDVEAAEDRYGRRVPKHAHGTKRFAHPTASGRLIADAVRELYDALVDERLLVRRVTIGAEQLVTEEELAQAAEHEQLQLFAEEGAVPEEDLARERKLQEAMLGIRERFGKNAVLKAASLQEGATAAQRNAQIGGHSA